MPHNPQIPAPPSPRWGGLSFFLLLGLTVLLGACAGRSEATSMHSMAPPEMAAMSSPGQAGIPPAPAMDGRYDVDSMDSMDEELAEAEDSAVFRTRSAPGKMKRQAKAGAIGGAAPARTVMAAPPPPASASAPEPSPEAAIADPDALAQHNRQIVYIAGMRLAVYNLSAGMAHAEAIPARVGGWIHSRSEGLIVMKIPAAKLRAVMDELAALGNVEDRTLQASDVTAEFTDLESRIRVMTETQAHLLKLLSRAKNVEEALHVRAALDRVTMDLEVAIGRMRQLQNMISFSTLTVALIERGPNQPVPSENDPFPWVDSLGVEVTEWR